MQMHLVIICSIVLVSVFICSVAAYLYHVLYAIQCCVYIQYLFVF